MPAKIKRRNPCGSVGVRKTDKIDTSELVYAAKYKERERSYNRQ